MTKEELSVIYTEMKAEKERPATTTKGPYTIEDYKAFIDSPEAVEKDTQTLFTAEDYRALISEPDEPEVPSKPIGAVESLTRFTDWYAKLMPLGIGAMQKQRELSDSIARLESNNYESLLSESSGLRELKAMMGVGTYRNTPYPQTVETAKQEDIDKVNEYVTLKAEEMERGYSVGGKIAQGIAAWGPYFLDFAYTGSVYGVLKTGSKTILKRVLRKQAGSFLGKATSSLASSAIGSVGRTTMFAPMAVEKYLERQLPDNIKIDETGSITFDPNDESKFRSLAKAVGSTYIETFSETLGGDILKGAGVIAGKTPVAKKAFVALSKLWKSKHQVPFVTAIRRFSKDNLYDGLFGEWTEERAGSFLHAVFGTEDFEADKLEDAGYFEKTWERVKEAMSNDLQLENIIVEAVVLSGPSAAMGGISLAANAVSTEGIERRQLNRQLNEQKKILKKQDGTEQQIMELEAIQYVLKNELGTDPEVDTKVNELISRMEEEGYIPSEESNVPEDTVPDADGLIPVVIPKSTTAILELLPIGKSVLFSAEGKLDEGIVESYTEDESGKLIGVNLSGKEVRFANLKQMVTEEVEVVKPPVVKIKPPIVEAPVTQEQELLVEEETAETPIKPVQGFTLPDQYNATYRTKDQLKANLATKVVAFGAPGTSTTIAAEAAKTAGLTVNDLNNVEKNDVVVVSINGRTRAALEKNYNLTTAQLEKAVAVGATIITDTKANAKRKFNNHKFGETLTNAAGEEVGGLAGWLMGQGYTRQDVDGVGRWTKTATEKKVEPKVETQTIDEPVENVTEKEKDKVDKQTEKEPPIKKAQKEKLPEEEPPEQDISDEVDLNTIIDEEVSEISFSEELVSAEIAEADDPTISYTDHLPVGKITNPAKLSLALKFAGMDISQQDIGKLIDLSYSYNQFVEKILKALGKTEEAVIEVTSDTALLNVFNWKKNAEESHEIDVVLGGNIVQLREFTGKDLSIGKNKPRFVKGSLLRKILGDRFYTVNFYTAAKAVGPTAQFNGFDQRGMNTEQWTNLVTQLNETGFALLSHFADTGTTGVIKIAQDLIDNPPSADNLISTFKEQGVPVTTVQEEQLKKLSPNGRAAAMTTHNAFKLLFGNEYYDNGKKPMTAIDIVRRIKILGGSGTTPHDSDFPEGFSCSINPDLNGREENTDGAGHVSLAIAKKLGVHFEGTDKSRIFKAWVTQRTVGGKVLLVKCLLSVAPKEFDMGGKDFYFYNSGVKISKGIDNKADFRIKASDVRIIFTDDVERHSKWRGTPRQWLCNFIPATNTEARAGLTQILREAVNMWNKRQDTWSDPTQSGRWLRRVIDDNFNPYSVGHAASDAGVAMNHPWSHELGLELIRSAFDKMVKLLRKENMIGSLIPATGKYLDQLEKHDKTSKYLGIFLPSSAKKTTKIGDIVGGTRSPIISPAGYVAAEVIGYLEDDMGQGVMFHPTVVKENFNADFDGDDGAVNANLPEGLIAFAKQMEDSMPSLPVALLNPVADLDAGSPWMPDDMRNASQLIAEGKTVIGQVANLATLQRIIRDNEVTFSLGTELLPESEVLEILRYLSIAATDTKLGLLKQWNWFEPWGLKNKFHGRDRGLALIFGLAKMNWETGEWNMEMRDWDVLNELRKKLSEYKRTYSPITSGDDIFSERMDLEFLHLSLNITAIQNKKVGFGASPYEEWQGMLAEIFKSDYLNVDSFLRANGNATEFLRKKYGYKETEKVLATFLKIKEIITEEYDKSDLIAEQGQKLEDDFWQDPIDRINVIMKNAGLSERERNTLALMGVVGGVIYGKERGDRGVHPIGKKGFIPDSRNLVDSNGRKWSRPFIWLMTKPMLREYAAEYNWQYAKQADLNKELVSLDLGTSAADRTDPIIKTAKKDIDETYSDIILSVATDPVSASVKALIVWAKEDKSRTAKQIIELIDGNTISPINIQATVNAVLGDIGDREIIKTSDRKKVLRALEILDHEGRKLGWFAATFRMMKRIAAINSKATEFAHIGYFAKKDAEGNKIPAKKPRKMLDTMIRNIAASVDQVENTRTHSETRLLKGTSGKNGRYGLSALGLVKKYHGLKGFEAFKEAWETVVQLLAGEVTVDELDQESQSNNIIMGAYQTAREELDLRKEQMGHFETDEAVIKATLAKGEGYGSYVNIDVSKTKKERRFIVYGESNIVSYIAYLNRKKFEIEDEYEDKIKKFVPDIPMDINYYPRVWESHNDYIVGYAKMVTDTLAPLKHQYGVDSKEVVNKRKELHKELRKSMEEFNGDSIRNFYGSTRFFANFQHRRSDIGGWVRDPFVALVQYIENFDKKLILDKMTNKAADDLDEWIAWRGKTSEDMEHPSVINAYIRFVNEVLGRPSRIDLYVANSWAGKVATNLLHLPISKKKPFQKVAQMEGSYRFRRHIGFKFDTAAVNLWQIRNTIIQEGFGVFKRAMVAMNNKVTAYTYVDPKTKEERKLTLAECLMDYSGIFSQMSRAEIRKIIHDIDNGEFGANAKNLLPKVLGGKGLDGVTTFESLRTVMSRVGIDVDTAGQYMFNWSEKKTRAWAWATGFITMQELGLDVEASIRYGREVVSRDIYQFNVIGRSAFQRSAIGSILMRYTLYPINQNLFVGKIAADTIKHPTDKKAWGKFCRMMAYEGMVRAISLIPQLSVTIHERYGDDALEYMWNIFRAFIWEQDPEERKKLQNLVISRNPLTGVTTNELIALLVAAVTGPLGSYTLSKGRYAAYEFGFYGDEDAKRQPTIPKKVISVAPYGPQSLLVYDILSGKTWRLLRAVGLNYKKKEKKEEGFYYGD